MSPIQPIPDRPARRKGLTVLGGTKAKSTAVVKLFQIKLPPALIWELKVAKAQTGITCANLIAELIQRGLADLVASHPGDAA